MYFILKEFHSLKEIVAQSEKIFGVYFNEKLLRVQLTYFDDIDYSEKILYMPSFKRSDEAIKKALKEYSLE
jgi:hypothetical protein